MTDSIKTRETVKSDVKSSIISSESYGKDSEIGKMGPT